MKNVLFITHFYPPINNSGIFRALKFSKYLKKNEQWNPIVLTVNPNLIDTAFLNDEFVEEIKEIEVHHVDTLRPTADSTSQYREIYREAHIPDTEYGSIMHYVIKGLELIKEKNIDLIYCTIPPYSTGIVGALLKDLTNLPLVVDYRDGWTRGNDFIKYRTEIGATLNAYFEEKMQNKADYLITVDKELAKEITTTKKIAVITNGFDSNDFKEEPPVDFKNKYIYYGGYFYKEYEDAMLRLINCLVKFNEYEKLELIITGKIQRKEFQKDLEKYSFIKYIGPVSYKESITYSKKAAINLGIFPLDFSVASKYYNLIPAKRPILSMNKMSNGFLKEFLDPFPAKEILPLDVSNEILEQSIKELLEFDGDIEISSFYDKFERSNLTLKLEDIFNEVYENNNSNNETLL